ncbi:oligosaccharide flippase family protein [Cytobacillus sp. FJAT-53684]|uniref:Oligosaccharide flippase family protein n=1 Tax=Cytobacillus mangrovibacter TaxID=3299024 RepID=A0ABW6K5A0_9BACI
MKRLINNYIYNLIYQMVTLVLPFLLIPYVIRVLGPENLGIETYTLSVLGIFIIVGNLGINNYATRQIARIRDNQNKLQEEVYHILLIRTFASSFTLLLYIIFTFSSDYYLIFLIQIIYFISSTFFEVSWYYSGTEKFKEIMIRNIFSKLVGAALIFTFVNESKDLWIYILINGLVILIPNLYLTIKMIHTLKISLKTKLNRKLLINQFREILPFFFMGFIIQLYMNVDKIILEWKDFTIELGIYSQMLKSVMSLVAPITAVGTILFPYISNITSKKEKEGVLKTLSISVNFISILSFGMFFGLQAVSSQFIGLFFGESYLEYENLFRITALLILTTGLYNVVIQQIIFPNKLEKFYTFSIIIATVIKTLLLILTISIYGIYSTIISYLIGEIIILVTCLFKVNKILKLSNIYEGKNIFKILCAGLLMFGVVHTINFNLLGDILTGIFSYLAFLFILKERIITTSIKKTFKRFITF